MTTVASIISDAFRETNLNPLGVAPTTDQQTEGFRLLSTIVEGVLGNEAGENLRPMPLGQHDIVSPAGFPWWNNQLPGNVFIPTNVRVMCNLTGQGTINLHPQPHDGARFGVVDVSQNFDVNHLTIHGNGRSIEGQDVMAYNTPGLIREWLYREDLGNWVVSSPITLTGNMPWPAEFDDMFIVMLAMRLNPRNGQVMHPASVETLKRAQSQFSARYTQTNTTQPSEDGLLYTSSNYRQYGRFSDSRYGDPSVIFNSGYPY